MKPKTIYLLIITLAVLLGLWQGQSWWRERQAQQASGWVMLETDTDAGQVNKIVLKVADKELTLERKDNEWQVGGKKASQTKVEELLKLIQKPQVELVSQNPERHADLGMNDSVANRISFWQGEKEVTMLVASGSGQLVRQKDKQNVYRLSQSLYLSADPTSWQAPEEPTPAATGSGSLTN